METLILAINPGSTSTKLTLFAGEQEIFRESLSHSLDELSQYRHVVDQLPMRRGEVLDFLKHAGHDPKDLSAVVGRGGLLKPIPGGTYRICEQMLADLRAGEHGEHASNLGAIIAYAIAEPLGIPSFIVDPVVVDELAPEARLSGITSISRKSIFHALNQKAVARQAAKTLGKAYEACNFVVAHMGGGVTVGAHKCGKVVDVNDGLNGDGPFSPERAGTLPCWDLIQLTLSFSYNRQQLQQLIIGQGGMVDYLQTNDMRKAFAMMEEGDKFAALVVKSMAYQVAKEIGAMTGALQGKVDALVLTGGLAANPNFMKLLRPLVSWVGEVMVFPGEMEMEALTHGALRVLRGEEEAQEYS